MFKRGQITLFIILGIVVFLVITFSFYLTSRLNITKGIDSSNIEEVMSICLNEKLDFTLILLGMQGGYYDVKEPYNLIEFEDFDIKSPFYYYNGENLALSLEDLENNMEYVLEKAVVKCVEDFNVETGEPDISVKINNDDIRVDLEYPITIVKGDTKERISSFNTVRKIGLGKIYNVATSIAGDFVRDDNSICISCLKEMVDENDLVVNYYVSSENVVEFYIIDKESQIFDVPYVYMFSNKLKE